MNRTLAIDPGANGGLAWECDGEGIGCESMANTEGDVLNRLREFRTLGIEHLVMEDQTGCVGPNMKVSAASMFTFGRGFGFILGAAQALGYRVELVRPMKWQKHLSLGSKKDAGGNTAWKRKLKAEAQRRFPECDVTLKTADALLLLAYARNGCIEPTQG